MKVKSSDTDESSDDEDSKMKSYITRQFKKFMKNANERNFDKDCKQSNSSQFKGQDKGRKDAKEGGQYIVTVGPKCFLCEPQQTRFETQQKYWNMLRTSIDTL